MKRLLFILLLLPFIGYSQTNWKYDLYLKMNSAAPVDKSTYNRTITIGASIQTVPGYVDNACYSPNTFGANTTRISVAAYAWDTTNNGCTISFFIRQDSTIALSSSIFNIYGRTSGSTTRCGYHVGMITASGGVKVGYWIPGNNTIQVATFANVVTLGKKTHILISIKGASNPGASSNDGSITLYKNGEFFGTITGLNLFAGQTSTARKIFCGTTINTCLCGLLDEFSILNAPTTAAYAKNLYDYLTTNRNQ